MTAAKKHVVIVDTLSYRVPIAGTTPVRYGYRIASRGDEVELPTDAVDRFLTLGAIADPKDAEAALAAATTPTVWTDQQVAEASADELIAYVQQNGDEAERIGAVELAGKRRKTVLLACGLDENGDPLDDAGA